MLSRRRIIAQGGGIAVSCLCFPKSLASMESELHFCTEIIMDDLQSAFDKAIEENPDNNPARQNLPFTEAVSLFNKKWHPARRILHIGFLQEPAYIDTVIEMARIWENFMGISFRFGVSRPDILIDFEAGPSWSYIGTDSLFFSDKGRPSMNFGWFGRNTAREEFRRTTLHEFGHALSLVHEHSHPTGNISWNKPVVYRYYAQRGWDQEQVDRQVFRRYSLTQVNGSEYDPLSIMHYPIPSSLVADPADEVGWNNELSDLDRAVIGQLYPLRPVGFPG